PWRTAPPRRYPSGRDDRRSAASPWHLGTRPAAAELRGRRTTVTGGWPFRDIRVHVIDRALLYLDHLLTLEKNAQGRPPAVAAYWGVIAMRRVGVMAVLAGTAVLVAGAGVAGVPQSAALAGSAAALNWTKQAPATSPPVRDDAAMAYDAATQTVVLFGGESRASRAFGDTWVWDGVTWTKLAPAASPLARRGASMAYDAATGTVVLFG